MPIKTMPPSELSLILLYVPKDWYLQMETQHIWSNIWTANNLADPNRVNTDVREARSEYGQFCSLYLLENTWNLEVIGL
jgi:hypothetical protein